MHQWRQFLMEIRGTSTEGASVKRRRSEDRGAKGTEGSKMWGGDVPSPVKEGSGEGLCTLPIF